MIEQTFITPVKEYFIDIPNYEGHYQVSNYGRVFSLKSNIFLTASQNKKNKIWNLKLSKYGKLKTFSCAKIVALSFLKNPNSKIYKYAIHKDGNLNDYSIYNIIWGTASQSALRKWERYPELKKNLNCFKVSPTQKMNNELIEKLFEMRNLGYSCRQLADIFPIKKSQIANIIKKTNIENNPT
jgi:hypothetical protein